MKSDLRDFKADKKFLWSVIEGLFWLAGGITASYFAISYATEISSNAVTDIILSNLRVFDVDALFVYGPMVYWVIMMVYVALHPRAWPFALKSLGLLMIIRSIFVCLTHIGPFPIHTIIDQTGLIGAFLSGNDLFFSGHVSMPFLMALVFFRHKAMFYFSLASSVFFGLVVLLGHLHYSIDVFGAFFITYTIYHLAKKLFVKDYHFFSQ